MYNNVCAYDKKKSIKGPSYECIDKKNEMSVLCA